MEAMEQRMSQLQAENDRLRACTARGVTRNVLKELATAGHVPQRSQLQAESDRLRTSTARGALRELAATAMSYNAHVPQRSPHQRTPRTSSVPKVVARNAGRATASSLRAARLDGARAAAEAANHLACDAREAYGRLLQRARADSNVRKAQACLTLHEASARRRDSRLGGGRGRSSNRQDEEVDVDGIDFFDCATIDRSNAVARARLVPVGGTLVPAYSPRRTKRGRNSSPDSSPNINNNNASISPSRCGEEGEEKTRTVKQIVGPTDESTQEGTTVPRLVLDVTSLGQEGRMMERQAVVRQAALRDAKFRAEGARAAADAALALVETMEVALRHTV